MTAWIAVVPSICVPVCNRRLLYVERRRDVDGRPQQHGPPWGEPRARVGFGPTGTSIARHGDWDHVSVAVPIVAKRFAGQTDPLIRPETSDRDVPGVGRSADRPAEQLAHCRRDRRHIVERVGSRTVRLVLSVMRNVYPALEPNRELIGSCRLRRVLEPGLNDMAPRLKMPPQARVDAPAGPALA